MMSALPPIADIGAAQINVCFGPKADIEQRLFDQLVGTSDESVGNADAERLGSPEIDDEIDFRRSLNWELGRVLAFQNPSDVDANLAPTISPAGTIANQTSSRRGSRGGASVLRVVHIGH